MIIWCKIQVIINPVVASDLKLSYLKYLSSINILFIDLQSDCGGWRKRRSPSLSAQCNWTPTGCGRCGSRLTGPPSASTVTGWRRMTARIGRPCLSTVLRNVHIIIALFIASYYRQLSTDIKMINYKIKIIR